LSAPEHDIAGVSDELYEATRRVFTDEEIAALALAVVEINGRNRLVRAFRPLVGSYEPAASRTPHNG
jgi:alkylhydroperoxidase family enzyme